MFSFNAGTTATPTVTYESFSHKPISVLQLRSDFQTISTWTGLTPTPARCTFENSLTLFVNAYNNVIFVY